VIVLDNEVKDMLVKLLEGQSRLEVKVNGLDDKVTGLETEVKKNSIELETIGKNINIIVELQTSHKEQSEVKESVDVMKDIIGRHQIDIEILKRRPV